MDNDREYRVLEYTVFCIENVARRLDRDPADVYRALTDRSDILHSYIIPGYDVLHTQDKEYIVNDILSVMAGKGVTVP